MPLKSMRENSNVSDENYVLGVSGKESFPAGLTLHLDHEQLKRLGIDAPEIGFPLMILAKAKVTGTNAHLSEEGEERNSVTVQITDMEIEGPKKDKSIAETIFTTEGKPADLEVRG